jgi:hypothetical protein
MRGLNRVPSIADQRAGGELAPGARSLFIQLLSVITIVVMALVQNVLALI